jgi:biopolymer transport protein ExbD
MAFNMTSGTGGRRSRGLPAMAEINVTPFVDVALVLLIIFIITAHVMDYGIEVNVPKTRSVASSAKDLPVVLLSKKGELYLNSSQVKLVQLASEIHSRFPGQNDVYVRADGQAPWEQVAQVSAELGAAKFNLKFVTQPADSGGRR